MSDRQSREAFASPIAELPIRALKAQKAPAPAEARLQQ